MSHPAILKAIGRLPGVPLSRLRDVSLSREQTAATIYRRCLHPDAVDREIVETRKLHKSPLGDIYDKPTCDAIQGMHRKYLEATGSGSWPNNCHADLYPHTDYHAATVWLDFEAFIANRTINREVTDQEWTNDVIAGKVWPTLGNPVKTIAECKQTFRYGGEAVAAFERPEWRQRSGRKEGDVFTLFDMSTWLVFESFRRVGIFFLEVFTGENGKHNMHEKHIQIPGGTSGYAYFNNGSCGDHVTSNIDSLLSYDLGFLTALRTHEFGHNNNLQHEFREPQSRHRSVMSYAFLNDRFQGFRRSGEPYEFVEDHSIPELIRYYGGDPAKPIDPTIPPPPPSDNPLTLPGRFTVDEFSPDQFAVRGNARYDRDVVIKAGAEYIMTPNNDGTYSQILKPPT